MEGRKSVSVVSSVFNSFFFKQLMRSSVDTLKSVACSTYEAQPHFLEMSPRTDTICADLGFSFGFASAAVGWDRNPPPRTPSSLQVPLGHRKGS